jgi:glycosyltransferase involved in cell wall biosynthesis
MRHTVVVVPCYNESARLDVGAFLRYASTDRSVVFLFVNDGSTDRTQEILERIHQADPSSFQVLHLAQNGGKGEAVRRGVLAALESDPAFVGYWDADLATPLEVIPEFCELLEARPGRELALGARVRLLGRDVRRSVRRHYLGRVFATVASRLLDLNVYDTQCGAKMFRVTPRTRLLFDEPFRSTWIFDVEIIARLLLVYHRSPQRGVEQVFCEVPLKSWHDVPGSKLKASDFLRAPLELIAIYRHYLTGVRRHRATDTRRWTPRPHLASLRRKSEEQNADT